MQDLLSTCSWTEFIDYSTTSYTIKYSLSGIGCGFDTVLHVVPIATCIGGKCSHIYDLPSSCSNVTVIVYATSILEDGRESEPVTIILGQCKSTR